MTDVLDRVPAVREEVRPGPAPTRSSKIAFQPEYGWSGVLGGAFGRRGLIHLAMVPSHMDDSTSRASASRHRLAADRAAAVVTRPSRRPLRIVCSPTSRSSPCGRQPHVGLPFGDTPGTRRRRRSSTSRASASRSRSWSWPALLARPGLGRARRRCRGSRAPSSRSACRARDRRARVAERARPRDGSHGDHAADEAAGRPRSRTRHESAADDQGLSLLATGTARDRRGRELDAATRRALDGAAHADPRARQRVPDDRGGRGRRLPAGRTVQPGLGTHYSPGFGQFNSDGDMDPEDIAQPDADLRRHRRPTAARRVHVHRRSQAANPRGSSDRTTTGTTTRTSASCRATACRDAVRCRRTSVTSDMCDAVGGAFIEYTGYMVHVWTVPGYESPHGVFSEINPKITCPDGTYYRSRSTRSASASSCKGQYDRKRARGTGAGHRPARRRLLCRRSRPDVVRG